MLLSTASPIAKTAFDALQAKRSAIKVGYTPVVVSEEDVYKELVERITAELGKFKRQTPLVNAGYAIRVLAISHAIHTFISYHNNVKATKSQIQLVLLGCGMDVIGLWAGLLDFSTSAAQGGIQIIEIDTKEVCSAKQEILLRQGLVRPATTDDDNSSRDQKASVKEVFRGEIMGHPTNAYSNYTLIPADLRDTAKLDELFSTSSSFFDPSAPTLVLSELVLTYLAPAETSQILKWCATRLCLAPCSAVVVLEPLGPSSPASSSTGIGSDGNIVTDAVVQGYKQDYCQQFEAKLERGKSSTSTFSRDDGKDIGAPSNTTSFYPLGDSSDVVAHAIIQAGFDAAHGACLGRVAASIGSDEGGGGVTFASPEIFDEHAALTLHLRSYALTCGLSKDTDKVLRRMLCPWFFADVIVEPPPQIVTSASGITTVFTVIERMDEIPLRALFLKTYDHLFEDHPALRKMAKTALKTDLALSNVDLNVNDNSGRDSSIASRYRALGGVFVVAIQYDHGVRRVVGCVGLRHSHHVVDPDDGPTRTNPMEIFRLLVDDDQRGQGIGTKLCNFIERFAVSRGCNQLIANTLTILKSANRLYERCGYKRGEEVDIGTLVMRKYSKDL